MRFLLIDTIWQLEPGRGAQGSKNVTMSEDFLADHFPDRPIMPGMLIVEALVQLADWVLRCGTEFEQLALATSFDRVKFRRMVRPGDRLDLEVTITERKGTSASAVGRARVGDELVASVVIGLTLLSLAEFIDPAEARKLLGLLMAHSRPLESA